MMPGVINASVVKDIKNKNMTTPLSVELRFPSLNVAA